MTDPISDMLTRLRNAVSAKHTRVDLPASKLKAEIARILQDEGYIQGFRIVEEPAEKTGRQPRQVIRVFLSTDHTGEGDDWAQRISRPGSRVYSCGRGSTGTGRARPSSTLARCDDGRLTARPVVAMCVMCGRPVASKARAESRQDPREMSR